MSDKTEPIAPATVVVVSGGSRGLGLAIVEDILAQGAKVAAFARTVTPELEAVAAAHPDRVVAASVDVTDVKAINAFLKDAESRLGRSTPSSTMPRWARTACTCTPRQSRSRRSSRRT